MRVGRKRSSNLDLPPGVRLIKGRYYYLSTRLVDGKRPSMPLGSDPTEMRRKWAELRAADDAKQPAETPAADLFAAVIDRFVADELPRKKPDGSFRLAEKTRGEYERQAKILRKVFGPMRYVDIKPTHVAQYLDNHASMVSANREVSLLSRIFACAMRWGLVDANPCTGVQRHTEVARARELTHDELDTLYQHAGRTMKVMMDICYVTGMRESDMLTLMLPDFTDAGIDLRHKKTGVRQLFEMTDELRAVIAEAKALARRASSFYVFCARGGLHPYTVSGFQSNWRRLLAKAKLDKADIHWHDIRARAIMDAEESGQDPQKFAGHKSRRTTEIYLKNRKKVRATPNARISSLAGKKKANGSRA